MVRRELLAALAQSESSAIALSSTSKQRLAMVRHELFAVFAQSEFSALALSQKEALSPNRGLFFSTAMFALFVSTLKFFFNRCFSSSTKVFQPRMVFSTQEFFPTTSFFLQLDVFWVWVQKGLGLCSGSRPRFQVDGP